MTVTSLETAAANDEFGSDDVTLGARVDVLIASGVSVVTAVALVLIILYMTTGTPS